MTLADAPSSDRDETMTKVDFIYGLGSRYSYLASTQIVRIARETGTTFRWQPVSSHALLGRRNDNPFRGDCQVRWRLDCRERLERPTVACYGARLFDDG